VDVPVFMDGEQVATTGPDGTATVRLPATGATIAVERGGMRAETTVSGLLWNLLAVVGAVAALVGATLLVAWRRGYSPRDLFRIARRIPGLVVQYTHWLLITFVTRGDEWLRRVLVRIRLTVSHLLGVARGRMSPAQLWAALKTWLGARRRALADALGRTSGVAASEGHSTDRVPEAQISVRDAWVRFLQCVSVAPHRAMTFTPGELATHAIEHDRLPAEAVVVLRDVFREVEYGSRSASDRLERVESAVERIERASREQDGQPSSDHVTGGRAD
jgi:hypothetical protein